MLVKLKAIPENRSSWNYKILDGARHVADLQLDQASDSGGLTILGDRFAIRRVGYVFVEQGVLHGTFILERDSTVLARAEKKRSLQNSFTLNFANNTYQLQSGDLLKRHMQLVDGMRQIGNVKPLGFFGRKVSLSFNNEFPMEVGLFAAWLSLLTWKQESMPVANTSLGGS